MIYFPWHRGQLLQQLVSLPSLFPDLPEYLLSPIRYPPSLPIPQEKTTALNHLFPAPPHSPASYPPPRPILRILRIEREGSRIGAAFANFASSSCSCSDSILRDASMPSSSIYIGRAGGFFRGDVSVVSTGTMRMGIRRSTYLLYYPEQEEGPRYITPLTPSTSPIHSEYTCTCHHL